MTSTTQAAFALACLLGSARAEYERGPIPRGGETFRASFDQGQRADVGMGALEMSARIGSTSSPEGYVADFVEGRIGRALDVRPDREALKTKKYRYFAGRPEEASFKAQGNLCLQVGTLSFWCRSAKRGPVVKILPQASDRLVPPLVVFSEGTSVGLTERTYRDRNLKLPPRSLADDKWHHVAIAWDQAYGMCVYLDGQPWGDNWGKGANQPGYMSAGRISLFGCFFDEVSIFDLVLSQDQIAALAKGESVAPESALSEADIPAKHRLGHLGWLNAPEGHFPTVAGPTLVRRIAIEKARMAMKQGFRATDGRENSVWPSHYHDYWYPDSRSPMRIFPARGESFNWMRLRSSIDQASIRVSDRFVLPEDARVLAELTGERFVTNLRVDPPCAAPAVTVYPHKPKWTGPSWTDAYYWYGRKELHDIAFLDVRPGQAADPVVLQGTLTAQSPKTVAGAHRVRLQHWYRPGERRVLLGSLARAKAETVAIEPLRFVHLMLPPQSEDLPLSAVRLQLKVDGWQAGNTVNVRVHDPFNLWRTLSDVDVRLASPGDVDLTLEFVPTILPRDTELWVTLISRDRGQLRCGAGGSTLSAHGPDMKTALASYYDTQHRLLKDDFEYLTEPHPWSYATKGNAHLRIALARYDSIARKMWDLYERFSKDRWCIGYVLWTQRSCYALQNELRASLPVQEPPRDPDAPEWAVLQKEISRMQFDFVHWWIDNRQAPNGEFGNTTGDDTDLTGDWVSMALLSDRDGKIRRSQRLLTDFVWNHRMSNGLNKGMNDALHAYEAGNNMQPFAALLDYGNPVLMERQFMTSRRYDGFLMTDPVDGKRRLVGGFFNSEEVRPGSRYKKQNHNRLILHAGLYTMFYNGHPGLLKLMIEYYDGSPPMRRGRTGDLEYALYTHTGDKRFVERCKCPARYHNWPRLLGITKASPEDLKHLTGPPSNRKLMRRYNAWRFTGDKKYLVEALRCLWRELYYKYDMVTRTEQSGDRVHLTWLGSKTFTDHMYFGGMPGARNELLPLHTVSYEGFSPNFAGLVIDDTTEALRWVGYNFEPAAQDGKLRVWRLMPGVYEVRMGEDRDGDDRVDADAKKVTLDLKRYEPIPVTLPSRKLYVVEAKLLRRDPVPLYDRCDLAITHEDAVREGTSLRVIVHNIGCKPSGPFTVEVKDGAGRVLATKRHGGLDGVADLNDKKIMLTFAGLPARADLQVHVAGPAKEITEANNAAWIRH